MSIANATRARLSSILFVCDAVTYVVTEACINCKHTDCVDVCPVDAFREGKNFLAIDPDECIDCTLCVPECPVGAIYAEADVPVNQTEFIAINARLSKVWPVILITKDPLQGADDGVHLPSRREFLIEL